MVTALGTAPKISLITVVRNAESTIADCMASIVNQTTQPFEYIIIDGKSTDRTLEVITQHSWPAVKVISEPDDGIYDAMNKGIKLATGDIIGILNSDDFYYEPQVLEKVSLLFKLSNVDAIFADLIYVRPDNLNRIVRYYSGADFTPDKLAWGWMPPHPTFFVKREIYERYGLFRTNYKIAADYELMARLLSRYKVNYAYLPKVLVCMRTGGVSTRNLQSNWILNREIKRACLENGISTNILKIYSKYFCKIKQLFTRPA